MLQRISDDQLPNSLSDEPVTTPADFKRDAGDAATRLTFATSRSEKPSPYADPDHIGRICADSLALMGVDESDGVLNLCAPAPHLSGFAAVRGAETLGATVFNDHFEDVHRVVEAGHGEAVTVTCSTPSMLLALAREIGDRYGDPSAVFPNLELALIGGEVVRPWHRRRVKAAWGVDRTREYYGSSEVCMIASAVDESRRLVPHLHRFVLELEVDGRIVDVREPTEPTEGSILVTDPVREAVDLTRYRQGDRVRVYPGDELPRIEPLGRVDDAIDLDGALIHPADLYAVVDAVYPESTECVPFVRDVTRPHRLELFLVGASSARRDAFLAELVERNPAVAHVTDAADGRRLSVTVVDALAEIPVADPDTLGSQPVVFQSALADVEG